MNHKTLVLKHIIQSDDVTFNEESTRAISIGYYSKFIALCDKISQAKPINKINTLIRPDDIVFAVMFDDGELFEY